jgi:hypothetical protein
MYGDTNEEKQKSFSQRWGWWLIIGAPIITLVVGITTGYMTRPADPPHSAPARDCTSMPSLTNEEIIATTNQCTAAGLGATALQCGDNAATIIIQCKP